MKRFSSRLAQGGYWGLVYCWRYCLATDYANHTTFGPGCHAVVLLLLLAHIGDILERHHRRDAYQAQQAAEETLLQKIDTTDDRSFLNHLMSQAMQSQNAFPLLILRTELKKFGWFWPSTGLIVLPLGRLPPGLLAILYRQSNIGISSYKTIHYWTY